MGQRSSSRNISRAVATNAYEIRSVVSAMGSPRHKDSPNVGKGAAKNSGPDYEDEYEDPELHRPPTYLTMSDAYSPIPRTASGLRHKTGWVHILTSTPCLERTHMGNELHSILPANAVLNASLRGNSEPSPCTDAVHAMRRSEAGGGDDSRALIASLSASFIRGCQRDVLVA